MNQRDHWDPLQDPLDVLHTDDLPVQPDPDFAGRLRRQLESALSLPEGVVMSGTTSAIGQGQGLVFTTRDRPVPSRRGWSAAPMRHGVSVLRSGRRHTLGLVFHDAK